MYLFDQYLIQMSGISTTFVELNVVFIFISSSILYGCGSAAVIGHMRRE